jgi:hypothetical protein
MYHKPWIFVKECGIRNSLEAAHRLLYLSEAQSRLYCARPAQFVTLIMTKGALRVWEGQRMEPQYTLRLLGLECLQAQELDGDETYLTLNDQRI